MAKIVVVGSINMDVVIRVPHIPVEGETLLAVSVANYGGGKGANQAVAVGRLGGDVSMIGRLGKDDYGKALFDNLSNSGIHTEGIQWDSEEPTGTAFINVSDRGENNIVVYSGANSRLDIPQVERYTHLLEQAEYCLMQLEIPTETVKHVTEVCRSKGIKVLLNPAPAQALESKLLKGLYMLIPNESELDLLCPEPGDIESKAKRLFETGVQNVLVTLGSKGCMLINNEGIQYFSAIQVEAKDTTAAGDSFIGGLAVGLSQGKTVAEAIRYASVVAGIAVSREGAQSSIPDRETVEAYIQNHDFSSIFNN
ncbi:ribokinase [Cohnella pontilimi]|uniref:Ribokinase n=1 Tax=Cohnella pontilimi TaxID=2564100 RepID=A0A4U0FDN0_9BACL|nr:ribokinase [Cohnella pontilimi]TJY42900.1 ribokinase [Cohnella pontilimi]